MGTFKTRIVAWLLAALALSMASVAPAQTLLSEDFTGHTSTADSNGNGNWLFFGGACLTAGTGTTITPPAATIPSCKSILSSYYNNNFNGTVSSKGHDPYLVGGANGYLGGTSAPGSLAQQLADPNGQGALRFTNGSINGGNGHGEAGAIVSSQAYSASAGVQVTFKTVTYGGDSGGNGSSGAAHSNSGADGISFFLVDGCMPVAGVPTLPSGCAPNPIYTGNSYAGTFPGIGQTGGSLAYSCSNANAPYDGLVGAYLGVGIDEYGNFMNGSTNTLAQTGVTQFGDNTYTGGGQYANRIGIRGAGAVAWQALANAYGTNPNDTTKPYYPANLATYCSSGTYDAVSAKCESCSSGVYSGPGTNTCSITASTTNCPLAPVGSTYTYDGNLATGSQCVQCPVTSTYQASITPGVLGTCNSPGTPAAPTAETYATGGNACPTGYNYTGTTGANGTTIPAIQQCQQCASGTYTATFSASYPYGYCSLTTFSTPTYSGYNVSYAAPSFKAWKNGNVGSCNNGYSASGDLTANFQCESCSQGTYSLSNHTSTAHGSCVITATSCPVNTNSTGSNTSGYQCASCSSGTYTSVANGGPSPYGGCGTTTQSSPGANTYTNNGTRCANGYQYAATNPYGSQCVQCPGGGAFTSSGSGSSPYGSCAVTVTAVPAGQTAALTTLSYIASTASNSSNLSLAAVQNTCRNGVLYNYATAGSPVSVGGATLANAKNTAGILDYPAIASSILSGVQIANEAAATRTQATPIFYNLKITQDGLLSLAYAVNGSSAYTTVISNKSITTSNGPLPSYVRFGFAGSTGGASNIHEVLCFKAAPALQSASSAGANQKPAGKVQTGSYAYFASYSPTNSIGHLTANGLSTDTTGALVIAGTPTWDASCVLTGATAAACATGAATSVEAPSSRAIVTWNGAQGVPFQWAYLGADQQAALIVGDPVNSSVAGPNRVSYLRGDRAQEISTAGTCPQGSTGMACFRDRDSVLGDIVDSSPTWVGPPLASYASVWSDRLYPTATPAENTGTQNYQQFITAEQTRTNIVYVGANDGMLHGFRSGANNANGTFNTSALNDGDEVLAYVPGAVLNSPASQSSAGCPTPVPNPMAATLSMAQNIHGMSPVANGAATCTAPTLDYSHIQYGHNFFVDATPGTGDLFYNGVWHTWLVGGLGAGGAALYALDITDPVTAEANAGTAEGGAAGLVLGEWTPANLSCVNNPTSGGTCGASLGNTYGTPVIRRLHDGNWAVIFGNGFGSATGDAGIYVMTVGWNGSAITTSTYYLSTATGSPSSPNGIAYVTAADFDQDHVTDYIYAGDLQGNVWRFDLTSRLESTWTSTAPFKLFTTPSGQPITTQVQISGGATSAGANTVLVAFGTGARTQFNNLGAASYSSGTQYLYGVWDWNFNTWNGLGGTQFAALTQAQLTTLGVSFGGSSSTQTLAASNLQNQSTTQNATANGAASGDVTVSASTLCWMGSSGCTATNGVFGWSLNLPGSQEQIVYNPELINGIFVVDSVIPAANSPLSCTINSDTGYTYAVSIMNGGAVNGVFSGTPYSQYHDTQAIAEQTNYTGTPFVVTTADGTTWLIAPTTSAGSNSGGGSGGGGTGGTGGGSGAGATSLNIPKDSAPHRLTWVQLR